MTRRRPERHRDDRRTAIRPRSRGESSVWTWWSRPPASSATASRSRSTSPAGPQKVVLTVPAKDEIDATVVIGVNDDVLEPGRTVIVSNASCTTNCLAPLAKVLDDRLRPHREGFITTVHAYTNDQRLADVPHKDLRRSRARRPRTSSRPPPAPPRGRQGPAAPGRQARRDGDAGPGARRLDRRSRLPAREEAVDVRSELNAAVREAAEGTDAARSSSTARTRWCRATSSATRTLRSSTPLSTIATLGDNYVKVVSWYDNEWGYSNRVVDLLERVAAM